MLTAIICACLLHSSLPTLTSSPIPHGALHTTHHQRRSHKEDGKGRTFDDVIVSATRDKLGDAVQADRVARDGGGEGGKRVQREFGENVEGEGDGGVPAAKGLARSREGGKGRTRIRDLVREEGARDRCGTCRRRRG